MDHEVSRFYKDVVIKVMCLVLVLALYKFSRGYFSLVLVGYGLLSAVCRRNAQAVSCFVLFPLMVIVNSAILPKTGMSGMVLRLGPLLIGLALCVTAVGRKGSLRLPFGALFLYLFCSCLSSATGWSPMISYFKMINFILFLVGIWIGTQNLNQNPRDVYEIRCIFFSIVCIVILGSLAVLPFPNIAYSTNFMWSAGLSSAEMELRIADMKAADAVTLFSGIANHSQALAPLLAVCITFVLADMIFIARKYSLPHIVIMGIAVVELYMTRSRTGLLSVSVGVFMVLFYASKHVNMSNRAKRVVKRIVSFGIVLIVIGGTVGELKSNMISRWIFKTNDLTAEKGRGVIDRVSSTRQILIEDSLNDFGRNPLFGMGFQVNSETERLYGGRRGLVLSAPIEKGLLATMILGEAGIVGVIAFLIFLFSYYTTCARKKFTMSIVMFTVMLATNIGEATFFSPGGVGGIIWVMCMVGGFVLDMNLIREREYELLDEMRYQIEEYPVFNNDGPAYY